MDADLEAAVGELDEELGVHPVFFTVPSAHAVHVKVVLESYEAIGVVRTQNPDHGDGRILVVFLLVPDFADTGRAVLADLAEQTELRFLRATAEMVAELKGVLAD